MRNFLSLILVLLTMPVNSEVLRGLADDGREVELHEDGSWEYVSDHRFATTADGRRIRLKSDGSWIEVGEERGWITVPAQSLKVDQGLVKLDGYEVELAEVRVESVRTRQQKNTRLRSQIVARLNITGAALENLHLDGAAFKVTDSRGRDYPVTAFSLKSGSIMLIADGSPRWWGTKYFKFRIEQGILGNAAVELTKSMTEIVLLEVESLTQL